MPGRRPDRIGPVSSVTPWRTSTSVVNGGALGSGGSVSAAGSAGASDIAPGIVTAPARRVGPGPGFRFAGSAAEAEEFGGHRAGRAGEAGGGNGAGRAGDLVDGRQRHHL